MPKQSSSFFSIKSQLPQVARHLYNVHSYYKKDAAQAAIENEYYLNPQYYRKRDLLRRYEEEDR